MINTTQKYHMNNENIKYSLDKKKKYNLYKLIKEIYYLGEVNKKILNEKSSSVIILKNYLLYINKQYCDIILFLYKGLIGDRQNILNYLIVESPQQQDILTEEIFHKLFTKELEIKNSTKNLFKNIIFKTHKKINQLDFDHKITEILLDMLNGNFNTSYYIYIYDIKNLNYNQKTNDIKLYKIKIAESWIYFSYIAEELIKAIEYFYELKKNFNPLLK